MSYILDALKKLERERHLGRLPTLATDHSLPLEARPWISPLLGIVIVIVAVVSLIVWLRPGILGEATQDMASAPSAPQAKAEPQAPEALQPSAAKPVRDPHPGAPDKKEPLPAASKDNIAEKKAPPKTRPPANSGEERAPLKSARAALSPHPKIAPKTTQAAKEPAPEGWLDKAGANAPIETKINKPSKQAAIPGTPAPIAQPAEAMPAPEQISPDEVDEPPAGQASLPSLQQLPAETRSSLPELRISLLAYTRNAADRMVYINGAKYQEGQMVEGKVKVEAIVPEGAILSIQGQRFLLGR